MRLTLCLMLTLLVFGLVAFVVANMDARVSVNVWNTSYPGVHLFVVVFVSLTVGVVFTAIVALVEGATLRLANRKLRKEVHKLETENNFLRTQPATSGRREPDALDPAPAALPDVVAKTDGAFRPASPPSAPVYVPEDSDETE